MNGPKLIALLTSAWGQTQTLSNRDLSVSVSTESSRIIYLRAKGSDLRSVSTDHRSHLPIYATNALGFEGNRQQQRAQNPIQERDGQTGGAWLLLAVQQSSLNGSFQRSWP